MLAARYGHANAVDLLITKGNANVEATDRNGKTALMLAALNGHDNAVDILITKDYNSYNGQF
jgi:ankyrin repeat protein